MGRRRSLRVERGPRAEPDVSGLPIIAKPVYVRLWTQRNSSWLFNDYTYTSFNATATMTSPTPGSTLSDSSVTFNWSAGSGASQYWLEVGTSAGAGDLFEPSVGLATSQAVNGLPALGTPVYVRLWTLVGSRWPITTTRTRRSTRKPR